MSKSFDISEGQLERWLSATEGFSRSDCPDTADAHDEIKKILEGE